MHVTAGFKTRTLSQCVWYSSPGGARASPAPMGAYKHGQEEGACPLEM